MKCYSNKSNMSEIFGICDYLNMDEISNSILDEKIISFNTEEFIFDLQLPDKSENVSEIEFLKTSLKILHQKAFYTPACYNQENISSPPKTIMNIQNKLSTGRALNIIGLACFSIQYVSTNSTQQLLSFHSERIFSMNINLLPFSSLNDEFSIVSCINDISILEIFEKSIRLSITVTIQAIPCYDYSNYKTSIDELNSTYHGGVSDLNTISNFIKNGCDNLWTSFNISKYIDLYPHMPPILKIIKTMSSIEILSHKIISTPKSPLRSYDNTCISGKKLLINMNLKCKIMYACDALENSIHSDNFVIPIAIFIVIDGNSQLSSNFIINTCIENISIMVLNEHRLFLSTTAFVKVLKISCSKKCKN